MESNDNDMTVWMGALLILMVLVVVLVLGSKAIVYRHTEAMAKLGYQETLVPGCNGTVWRKAP